MLPGLRLPSAYELVEPTTSMLRHIAAHMRQADIDEVMASDALTPGQALEMSVMSSKFATITTYQGTPIRASGWVSVNDQLGCPWQLCSVDSRQHGKSLLRSSRVYVADWISQREVLANLVDARNTESITWLKWLGFSFGPTIAHGPQGMPFHPFWMRQQGCA